MERFHDYVMIMDLDLDLYFDMISFYNNPQEYLDPEMSMDELEEIRGRHQKAMKELVNKGLKKRELSED